MNNEHANILKKLESSNSFVVIETLSELRSSGKVTDIPSIVELLHSTSNPEIKSKVVEILANLKEAESVSFLVDAIRNPKYVADRKDLVACCWENGLDFSKYLSFFVDLLIGSEFQIAFEAYTVVVNLTTAIDGAIVDDEIKKMERAINSSSPEKKALMLDVVEFLPSVRI